MAGKPYYSIVPCCPNLGPELDYFNFPLGDGLVPDGVYVYTGTITSINGIIFQPDKCYTITKIGTSFSDYPDTPSFSNFALVDECENTELCEPCAVEVKCYTLYPCNPDLQVLVSTSDTLIPYIGEFTGLVGYEGCYFVVENDLGDCEGALNIIADPDVECLCALNCYSITGNPTSVTYVNENSELVTTSGSTRICSLIVPVVIGGSHGVVYNFGPCVDGVCPEVCFTFTNCITEETLIVTNTTTVLGYYANNNVVTVQGYEGCWTIDISEDPCDCAVNVTILQVYADCPTCLPIVAYKFTNCNNQSIIKYSLDDYSAYVGQTVKLDCGECWFVDLIDYMPPATQVINIITSFESCLACSRTYYELADCSGIEPTIYTYTDLSAEVGNVVKLKDCDICWEVNILEFPTFDQSSIATTVIVVISYNTCRDCNVQLDCKCSIAWPDINGNLSYIDCNGQLNKLQKVDPNTPTEKLCVRQWINAREPIYYGDCNEVGDKVVYECPPTVYPKRFIKPGYFTPQCDTEKYEKFACNSSEILYKTVLERRYGISNCCPDTSLGEKWLVKKELADLQGATDPNYTCTPVQTCCNNTPTCGCGCNSRSKTCNS